MFTKALLPDTLRAIKLVSKINIINKSYLAGGTALALHLGHRISVDLDFFTPKVFDENVLSSELETLLEFKKEGVAWRTVWGEVGKTKFSIFYYKHPLIKKTVDFEDIKVLQKEDIAAMKIHSLEDRGSKRDFFDLYFLAKEFSLDQILDFYDQKYSSLADHLYSIIRSFDYFVDAEIDADPQMIIPVSWQEVKGFFRKQAMELAKNKLKI